jgi:hypothetical protein
MGDIWVEKAYEVGGKNYIASWYVDGKDIGGG